jgi:hypothetical protein
LRIVISHILITLGVSYKINGRTLWVPDIENVGGQFKKMTFDKDKYFKEMKSMVDKAIDRLEKEKPDFEIFTASIWTDPNAAASSIGFESKTNSEKQVKKSNEWNKKYYDKYMAKGNLEQAKLFEPTIARNYNPAGFELRDFVEIKNSTIENNWEESTEGKCWDDLEPALKEVGEYAFGQINTLKIHDEFELSVNGRQDWYEFIWRKKE